ncbi:hypothetical protein ARMSODRAFT_1085523 [Armillaria solidipes]|uniref:Uncharacterized protein n=1 Tax=Armillaria solidipes TaxID=1076256 RepID=A0A2H3BBG3_9AGAR|nr:hypothetical protein ARMSODRAFT_1085523 [Armillaria solidipes]
MSVSSDFRILSSEMTIFHLRCLLLLLSMAEARAVQNNDEGSDGSNGRTIWDIVWSCLATIFACTWLAVHPNVPSRYMREKGRLFLGLHRVKHMLVAIICPEAVIMWAFRQRLVASALSKHLRLSMTHSFFISMGGFVGKDDRPLTAADFFVPNGRPYNLLEGIIGGEIRSDLDISPILSVTQEELMDKSKGDALSKSISLLQTTWFVVQYISRIALSLPRTQLETATLAFALLNFCNYILWWHKPLDVQYPLKGKAIEDMGIEWAQFESINSSTSSLRSGDSVTVNDEKSWVSSVQLSADTVLEHEDPYKRAAEPRFPPYSSSSLRSSTHNSTQLIPDGGPTPYNSHISTFTSSISTFKQQISTNYIKNHATEPVRCGECLECDISTPVTMSVHDWRFFYHNNDLITDGLSRYRGSDEWSAFHKSAESILPQLILPTVTTENIIVAVSPVTSESSFVSSPAMAARSTLQAVATESAMRRQRYRLGLRQNHSTPALYVRVYRWYRRIFSTILHGTNRGLIPEYIPNATLPMLWAGQLNWGQIRYSAYFGGCFGALFGGIHCIGWSSSGSFDSSLEQLLWKVSSLSIAIIPVILALEVLTFNKFRWVPPLTRYSVPFLIFIYLCARIYILVDIFASLRSLPSAALEEIDWTRYIPHI